MPAWQLGKLWSIEYRVRPSNDYDMSSKLLIKFDEGRAMQYSYLSLPRRTESVGPGPQPQSAKEEISRDENCLCNLLTVFFGIRVKRVEIRVVNAT